MKVEIHSHIEVHSPCSRMPLKEFILAAEATGYDAVFLTDHGKVWSADELAAARALCTKLQIYPGIEITLPEGHDILVLGAEDPDYEQIRTPDELFAKACADDLLTVIAHPFRWHEGQPAYCTLADACEILTCNHPLPEQAERAREYAETNNMAPVYSGDSHGLNFMNRFWLETDAPFDGMREFRRLIVSGQYRNCQGDTSGLLPPVYKAASIDELTEEDMVALGMQPTS